MLLAERMVPADQGLVVIVTSHVRSDEVIDQAGRIRRGEVGKDLAADRADPIFGNFVARERIAYIDLSLTIFRIGRFRAAYMSRERIVNLEIQVAEARAVA